MIGDYRVRESCGRPPQGREVAVDHQVEDTWRFDFRVVDLNLIGLRASRQRAEENCHRQGKCEMEARRFPPSVRSHSYLDIRVLDLLAAAAAKGFLWPLTCPRHGFAGLAVGGAAALGFPLVPQLLALGQCEFQLNPPILE